eukprot:TRINITY_DN4859_c0_g1_i10.p1 TRINITY_DN4859_c0_g1~~TRINITY_DN4859_c0_g1_i10.p1  ORF type:complete len:153 (-),score=17.78 TRINITY_DN4859_c0_g1_i10:570-1028(-)
MDKMEHFHYKVVFVGDSTVGKTALVTRFVNKQFSERSISTIGASFHAQEVILDNGKVQFEIWDTAGQERFAPLVPMYYRGAHVAVVVFDLTNYDSFLRAQDWIEELLLKGNPKTVIVLAGNKSDLIEMRQVSSQVFFSPLVQDVLYRVLTSR